MMSSFLMNGSMARYIGITGNWRMDWLPSSMSAQECRGAGGLANAYVSSGITITRMSAGQIDKRVRSSGGGAP